MARSILRSCVSSLVDGGCKVDVGSLTELVGSDIDAICTLSKHQLEVLITLLSAIKKHKYIRSKLTKYGSINKGFTETELELFLNTCKAKKAKLAFKLMAFLGLRIGEVVTIKLTDIDFNKHVMRVHTEKANTLDEIYLHEKVRDDLYDWINIHRNQIIQQNNFILYSETHGRINISPHWLRNEFREVINKCGLNDVYGESEERYSKRKNRNLHRLTSHSLRHFFISKVYNNTKNPIHTQKLARHLDFKSTQVYIHANKEELTGSMKSTFEDTKVDMTEFKRFAETFKAWKETKE